jgi:hypothetical protein
MIFIVAYTLLNSSNHRWIQVYYLQLKVSFRLIYHCIGIIISHEVIGIIIFRIESCKQTIYLVAPLRYETVHSLQRWEFFDLLE